MNKPRELWYAEHTNDDQSFGISIELSSAFLFGLSYNATPICFEYSTWIGPISVNIFCIKETP